MIELSEWEKNNELCVIERELNKEFPGLTYIEIEELKYEINPAKYRKGKEKKERKPINKMKLIGISYILISLLNYFLISIINLFNANFHNFIIWNVFKGGATYPGNLLELIGCSIGYYCLWLPALSIAWPIHIIVRLCMELAKIPINL